MWGNIKVKNRVGGNFDPFRADVEFDGVLYDQSQTEVLDFSYCSSVSSFCNGVVHR